MRLRHAALAASLLLALAACGDAGEDDPTIQPPEAQQSAEPPSLVACASAPPTAPAPAGATTDTGKKPAIEIPDAPPPCDLQVSDIVVGTGKTATAGQNVSMQYVGVIYADGKQFDASWDRGEPLNFPLGAGNVIAGWDRGIVGMKEGGRRQLVIPPALGYGEQGFPPDIPPGSTLVFVVDLVKVG